MVAESSRPLLAASLSVALVKNDDQGNVRLSKNGCAFRRKAATDSNPKRPLIPI